MEKLEAVWLKQPWNCRFGCELSVMSVGMSEYVHMQIDRNAVILLTKLFMLLVYMVQQVVTWQSVANNHPMYIKMQQVFINKPVIIQQHTTICSLVYINIQQFDKQYVPIYQKPSTVHQFTWIGSLPTKKKIIHGSTIWQAICSPFYINSHELEAAPAAEHASVEGQRPLLVRWSMHVLEEGGGLVGSRGQRR